LRKGIGLEEEEENNESIIDVNFIRMQLIKVFD
jgi:hypothetical protein